MRESERPGKLAKTPRNLPSESLAILPQAEGPRFPKEALSQLNLIEFIFHNLYSASYFPLLDNQTFSKYF